MEKSLNLNIKLLYGELGGKDYESEIKKFGAISKTHWEVKSRKPKFPNCHFPFIA